MHGVPDRSANSSLRVANSCSAGKCFAGEQTPTGRLPNHETSECSFASAPAGKPPIRQRRLATPGHVAPQRPAVRPPPSDLPATGLRSPASGLRHSGYRVAKRHRPPIHRPPTHFVRPRIHSLNTHPTELSAYSSQLSARSPTPLPIPLHFAISGNFSLFNGVSDVEAVPLKSPL
jgi:hypothetical protein